MKKIVITAIVLILILNVCLVSAEETPIYAEQDVSPLTAFFNNIAHSLNLGPFTVVGDTRSCGLPGGNPNYEWEVAAGKSFTGSGGVLSGTVGSCPISGLYDTFTSGWSRYAEFKGVSGYICGDGPCNIQLYCCPKAEPQSQSDCTSGTIKTISCTSSINKGGQTFYWCKGGDGTLESLMPYYTNSYNYCTQTSTIKCYYKDLGVCSESNVRTYDSSIISSCSVAGNGGTYNGKKLFDSLALCSSNSGCLVNDECSSGKICSGGSCVIGTACTNPAGDIGELTYPGCDCASGKRTKKECTTSGWSNTISTLDCSSSQLATCDSGVTCTGTQMPSGGVCVEKSTVCEVDGGTKICQDVPTVVDPPVKATVYNVRVADEDGNKITSTTSLQQGQLVNIKFTVRIKYSDFALRFCNNVLDCITNPWVSGLVYDSTKELNIETGIIPAKVANAWFEGKDPGTFSINNMFAVTQKESQCCEEGQVNILADKTTLTKSLAGKTWEIIRDDSNSYAESEHEIQIQVPDKDTINQCPMVGEDFSDANPESYWDPSSEYYVLYIDIKNDCYAKNGERTGYTEAMDKLYELKLDVNGTGTSSGTICEDNADCSVGETCTSCSSLTTCTFWQKVSRTKKCSGGSGTSNSTIIKKYPLTREQISKSTSGDLLSAACYGTTECFDLSNYTVTCIPVSTLVKDGTMTNIQEGDLFSNGKAVLSTGLIGAGIGASICAVGIAAGTFTLGTSALVGCGIVAVASAGSLIGGAEIASQLGVGIEDLFTPELQQAINRGDSAKVGICTAEPKFDYCTYTEWAGFYTFPGTSKCTSGLIIIIIGFGIVFFLSKAGGNKK